MPMSISGAPIGRAIAATFFLLMNCSSRDAASLDLAGSVRLFGFAYGSDRSMRHAVVSAQRIAAKVTVEIAIDSVDMVCFVLRIVIFDEQRRPVNAVVVRLTGFDAACPAKAHLLEACTIEARQCLLRRGGIHASQVE